jgi:diguanylate cyclase (GGDEF)-like protein
MICWVHTAVAGANTPYAAGIGYLALTVVMFVCSLAFWSRTGAVQGTLYVRWCLAAAGAFAASIGYAPSFTQGVLNTPPARVFQTVCFNASEALYILAAVLFFAGVARSIVIVDMLQALLFVVLRFHLIYSSETSDHFAGNHLVIGQFMAIALFLVAMVACLGATSVGELKFLRSLSWFFGLRLVAYFLADQVSYTWLSHRDCSLWDVPGVVLLGGFSLYLLHTRHRAEGEIEKTSLSPGVTVRSLMPSFLALVNLSLALLVLRNSVQLAVGAISASLVFYMARTILLQGQAAKEKALLESRNEQLEGLAVRDPLTGIGNRRSLAGAYSELQRSGASGSVSLLLIDIDHFKQANDNHGHLHGDKVLIALAKKLERISAAVAGSHCARLGGDEFALLLLQVSSQKASKLGEELRAMFNAHPFATKGGTSLSIGVAPLHSARDLPLETLISYADKALYRAKLLGRNRVEAQPAWQPEIVSKDPGTASPRLELQREAS